jgi:hypothetical protein
VDKARHQEIRGRVRPPDLVVEIEVRVPGNLCACIGTDCAEKGCWAKRAAWIPGLRLSEDEMRKELGWPASPSP